MTFSLNCLLRAPDTTCASLLRVSNTATKNVLVDRKAVSLRLRAKDAPWGDHPRVEKPLEARSPPATKSDPVVMAELTSSKG